MVTSPIEQYERDLHPVFKTDPRDLWQYIGKKVDLITETQTYSGWVYTIDPVTHNWIIYTHTERTDKLTTSLINHQYVNNVHVLTDQVCPAAIQQLINAEPPLHDMNTEENPDRLNAICDWFKASRMPYEVRGDTLIVANGTLTIIPPYNEENMLTTSEVVLERIKNLLKRMPG